jgi:chorismate dehydratase
MLARADAALIIGDPAMTIPRDQFRVFDLAALWHEFTGCGFVFAMWMTRTAAIEKVRAIDFAAARDDGLANLDRVIADYPHETQFSENEMKQYLAENVVFRVDEEMRAGLQRYFELAHRHDLIAVNKPLEFITS